MHRWTCWGAHDAVGSDGCSSKAPRQPCRLTISDANDQAIAITSRTSVPICSCAWCGTHQLIRRAAWEVRPQGDDGAGEHHLGAYRVAAGGTSVCPRQQQASLTLDSRHSLCSRSTALPKPLHGHNNERPATPRPQSHPDQQCMTPYVAKPNIPDFLHAASLMETAARGPRRAHPPTYHRLTGAVSVPSPRRGYPHHPP